VAPSSRFALVRSIADFPPHVCDLSRHTHCPAGPAVTPGYALAVSGRRDSMMGSDLRRAAEQGGREEVRDLTD
jgi:hypothetical protein